MEKKLFDELKGNLNEAVKIAKGAKTPDSIYFVMTPEDIKAIREGTGMSQSVFARNFQISINTVKGWEQGKRSPDAGSTNFLRMIKADYKGVMKALEIA